MIYDLAIIGGGPAGYTAAEKAGKSGKKVIIFEKQALGGICLNEGCMPTKTLLHSAKIFDSLAEASRYGVKIENPSLDLEQVIKRKQRIVRRLTAGVRQKLTAQGVEQILHEAKIVGEDQDKNFRIEANGETYLSKSIILCTGSEAFIPPIKGLDRREYWTSRETLENKEVPQSLTIIGGGVIGTEFASFFNSLGTKVTVVEMLSEILGNMDAELSKMLREDLAKKGVAFHISAKVIEVTDQKVIVETSEGETIKVDAERLLLSTGRIPSTKNLGLETLSLEMHGRGLKVNEQMQTSDSRIYACGDITGQSLLAHTAIREAEVAVNTLLGKSDKMSYKAIPSVVYTSPEVAGVGMTEKLLKEKGIHYKVLQLPMAFAGRFMVENETGGGVIKILVDDNDILIGCHMIGTPASEIIVIAGIAIEKGFSLDEFKKIIFPHPTVGEIIHEVLDAEQKED